MSETRTYAVYFHAQALEVLGEAFKHYLIESPEGLHVLCREIDTSGAFCQLSLVGSTPNAKPLDVEAMIPSGMIRLVISVSGNEIDFGFG